jgi:hypothetical protein
MTARFTSDRRAPANQIGLVPSIGAITQGLRIEKGVRSEETAGLKFIGE